LDKKKLSAYFFNLSFIINYDYQMINNIIVRLMQLKWTKNELKCGRYDFF
jgi:hypothetical protein